MAPVTPKLFFGLCVIAKCQFLNDGCQLWPQLSKLFQNQFSKFLWLSENDKKQSGANIVGHPVSSKVLIRSFGFQTVIFVLGYIT